MAYSVEVRILDEIEELLGDEARPEGLSVHQFRSRPYGSEQLPATAVYPNGLEVVNRTHDGTQLNRLTVRLEHKVAADGDRPDQDAEPSHKTLDPLRVWASTRLLTPGAVTLAADIAEVSGQWDEAEMDRLYGGRIQDFEIDFWTTSADPTEAA